MCSFFDGPRSTPSPTLRDVGVSAGFVTQRVRDLTRLDCELPWVEFKRNTFDPVKIGEYISALANSAAIADQPYSFLIWGVDDDTHVPVGTTVNPWTAKVGNEDVIPWLRRGVSPPTADFEFHEIEIEGHRLVALVVERADASPVRFKRIPHIRDGSYTMELAERPLLERELFRSFDRTPFEARVAKDNCTAEQIASLLNLDTYVALAGNAGSSNTADLLSHLESDKLIRRVTADRWDILNCGALCLARRLDLFQGLKRKAVRFVQYEDETRARAIDTADGNKGYAEGFEGLLKPISGRLPRREVTDTHRRMVEDFHRSPCVSSLRTRWSTRTSPQLERARSSNSFATGWRSRIRGSRCTPTPDAFSTHLPSPATKHSPAFSASAESAKSAVAESTRPHSQPRRPTSPLQKSVLSSHPPSPAFSARVRWPRWNVRTGSGRPTSIRRSDTSINKTSPTRLSANGLASTHATRQPPPDCSATHRTTSSSGRATRPPVPVRCVTSPSGRSGLLDGIPLQAVDNGTPGSAEQELRASNQS